MALSAAALIAGACAEVPASVFLGDAPGVVLAVVTHASGVPLRWLAPFGADVMIPHDAEVELAREERLALIRLQTQDLATDFGFDRARASEIAPSSDPPPPEPTHPDREHVALAIPTSAILEVLDRESRRWSTADEPFASQLRANATLTLPIDPEACRIEGVSELRRFELSGVPDEWLFEVRILDRDHLLVAGGGHLYLFERGRAFVPSPANRIRYADFITGVIEAPMLALSPLGEASGTRHAAVQLTNEGGGTQRLIDIDIDASGLRAVRTTSIAGEQILGIAFDDQGTLVAAGGDHTVLVRAAGATAFSPAIAPDTMLVLGTRGLLRAVAATGISETPIAIAGESRVYLGDARTGSWATEKVGAYPLGPKIQLERPAFDAVSTGAWIVGDSSILERLPDGVWVDRSELPIPPRAEACIRPSTGLLDRVFAVALLGDRVLLLPDCTAVLIVDRGAGRHCTTVLPVPGQPIAGGNHPLFGLDARDRMVVVVGKGGAIYEATLP